MNLFSARPLSHLPRIDGRRDQLLPNIARLAASSLSWSVRLLPTFVTLTCAKIIGDITFAFPSAFRRNAASNIAHVMDLPANSPEVHRTVRSIFRTNALNGLEMLETPHLAPEEIMAGMTVREGDWSYITDQTREGRGVVLVTAHLGAFDFMGNALHQLGLPLTTLTTSTTSRLLYDAVSFLRRSHDARVLEANRGGMRQVVQALMRGECVALATDRDFFLSGREVVFFGESTTLPIGAARLARDTGAAIVPIFTLRDRHRAHSLYIKTPFTVPKTVNRQDDLEEAMVRIAAALEEGIGRDPGQWVMFQRVWEEDYASNRHETDFFSRP